MRRDEEVGDGGPKAEGDTNEWVEGGGTETLDDEDVVWVIVGDDNPRDSPRDCRELVPVESEDVEVWWCPGDDSPKVSPRDCRELNPVESEDVEVVVEKKGIDNEDGMSLVTRLVVLRDKPASCNVRILSAMLPLGTFCTPFSRGSEE